MRRLPQFLIDELREEQIDVQVSIAASRSPADLETAPPANANSQPDLPARPVPWSDNLTCEPLQPLAVLALRALYTVM